MAEISAQLQKIKDAIYGEDVRGSIHDSIKMMNDESSKAMEYAFTAQNSATTQASNALASANAASISEQNAKKFEESASSSALLAQTAETNASKSAEVAFSAETNAEKFRNDAANSASLAQTAESSVKIAESNAISKYKELQSSVSTMQQEVSTATSNASSAVVSSSKAKTTAETALSKAQQALKDAETALSGSFIFDNLVTPGQTKTTKKDANTGAITEIISITDGNKIAERITTVEPNGDISIVLTVYNSDGVSVASKVKNTTTKNSDGSITETITEVM